MDVSTQVSGGAAMSDDVQSTLVVVDEAKLKQMRKALLESVLKDCERRIEKKVSERYKNETPYNCG